MKPTVRLTLHNFANSNDFLKIANKLNHIVDTKRVYKLVDINDDEMQFYSLTDAKHTVLSKPANKVFVYNGSTIKCMTPKAKRYLIDTKIFYVINVEGDENDSMVISGEGFVAPDNDPIDAKAIEAKYDKYFERIKGQYNYVSLENIFPINGKFNDAHHLDNVGYNLLVGAYDTKGYNTVMCNYWGVGFDIGFNCHYDFAKRTISFAFNAMEGKNRDEGIMLNYIKSFNGTDVPISALADFIRDSDLNTFDYPRILDVMDELNVQTGVDFAVRIEKIDEQTTWTLT